MVAATGIGSGLDIEGLVTQLVAAERAPAENRILQRESRLTAQLSAFGTLQGSLNQLQSSANSLADLSTFSQRSATSSDSASIIATATASASPASLSVSVDELARSQSVASGRFDSVENAVGEGVLTFRFGTATLTPPDAEPQTFDAFEVNADRPSASVTIDSSNNSLQGVRDAINEADIGVTAAIVNDGEGFRLLLSSSDTGAANALEIQVSDTGDGDDGDTSGLSRLAFNAGAANLVQTVEARDARFSVNGLDLTSASNSVSEVIDGIDLTLRDTTETPVTVGVSDNVGAVRGAIEGFVDAFNNFANVANNLTAYNADTDTAGPLQGDFSARSITGQIRNALSSGADGFDGPFSTLAEIGIRTAQNGTLTINEEVFGAALSENFDDIAGIFANVGQVADSNIRFDGAGDGTQVGSFAVEVTQLATQGALAGSAITPPSAGSPLVIDGDNDSLTVSVNGTSSGAINLSQGSYESGAALAAEIQSRINGDSALSAAGISVSVSFNDSNQLEIRSSSFGSESTVDISSVGTNSAATLGLAVAAGTAGVDVAGSIGGVPATGTGQLLLAAQGSDAEGIRLTVTGGDLGVRAPVNFSTGVAFGLNAVLDGFLGNDGLLDLRADGLQTSVARLEEDREALATRLEAIEARFRRQFNALDSLLANLQSTSDFISQQLDNIPIPGQSNN